MSHSSRIDFPPLAGRILACCIACLLISAAQAETAAQKPGLVLLVAPFESPNKDLVAMTLGGMCLREGVEFDLYYAADHESGGLFVTHGSPVISGHHTLRIARALAMFRTTVVRLDSVDIFNSLLLGGAEDVIDGTSGGLLDLYRKATASLGVPLPTTAAAFAPDTMRPYFYPECVSRGAMAFPTGLSSESIAEIKAAGVNTVWTVAPQGANTQAWSSAGMEVKTAVQTGGSDVLDQFVQRWLPEATSVDCPTAVIASYMLAYAIRENRIMLQSGQISNSFGAQLAADKDQRWAYGRWFKDTPLQSWAKWPMAYQVLEPCRHILTVFSRLPIEYPHPVRSWADVEPSDEQLRQWIQQDKILTCWVLHSGELSHDDAVLTLYDWATIDKVCLGSGVHWQRFAYDPDAVEPLFVPVSQGGVLGLVEPVLHSAGNGIMWETLGDPGVIAGMMKDSRDRIAQLAGEGFAPHGAYFFADHHPKNTSQTQPTAAQTALWDAVESKGFQYVISNVMPGAGRILHRSGSFIVLNLQSDIIDNYSPFVRGTMASMKKYEQNLANQNRAGWVMGVLDSPLYVATGYKAAIGTPKEIFGYIQSGGVTGRLVPATPNTIARYARILNNIPPVSSAKSVGVQSVRFDNLGGERSVVIEEPGFHSVRVLASNGRVVDYRQGSGPARLTLDEELLGSGVYVMSVRTNSRTYNHKFVIH